MRAFRRFFAWSGKLAIMKALVTALFIVLAMVPAYAAYNPMELLDKAVRLVEQERYSDAEVTARKACKEFKRRERDHPALMGQCYLYLGVILVRQERQQEALFYLEASLKAFEGFLGKDTPNIAPALTSLAGTYMDMGRPSLAQGLYARLLAIYKARGSEAEIAQVQMALGEAYAGTGRIEKAEEAFDQALAIAKNVLDTDDRRLAYILDRMGNAFREQGRYGEAETRYLEALAIRERTLLPGDADFALSLTFLGLLYQDLNQIDRAIDFNQQALVIREQVLGGVHPLIAANLTNLGSLYQIQGRFGQAESYLQRAKSIAESSGNSVLLIASSLNNLAMLYSAQGNTEQAEKLFTRSLDINEKSLGADAPTVAISLNNIASLYRKQGRFDEAVSLYERSLAISVKRGGRDSIESLGVLFNLGSLYKDQKRYNEAEEIFTRVVSVSENIFGPYHSQTLRYINNMASLFAAQSRFAEALPLVQRAIAANEIDAELSIHVLREAKRLKLLSAQEAFALSYKIVQTSTGSSAALAVHKLAARYAGGSGELARDIRRDQDLLSETQVLENTLSVQLGRPLSERNLSEENRLRKRIEEIVLERKELMALIRERHPQYSALVQPQPLTLAETQALLSDDEAVVVLAVGAEKSFAWTVSRNAHGWADVPISGHTISEKVDTLRKSLTFERDVPFDTALAYELYQDLLGPIAGFIGGKRRLSVLATASLTALPLQLLVTKDPAGKRLKDVDWLVKSHAVTVIPSVFSLKTMRSIAGRSAASGPLIAFADPVFSTSAHRSVATDKLASRSLASFYQGSALDIESLSASLPQLPGTRREVLTIARTLGANPADVKLGLEASVTAVKKARLADYRIVYFATHALVSGELKRFTNARAEPALVLSIPQRPSAEDMGLIPASDVASLKLDADWVVLSACNTASALGPGAEPLSGLAQAFLYAGARSLVVSNWDVSDETTAKLMVSLFENSSSSQNLSHGEALQRAELSLLADAVSDEEAHPRNWGAFSVVGEPSVSARR